MSRGLIEFLRSRAGTVAIEYVIIAAVVSVGIIGGASAIGDSSAVHMQNILN